MGDLVLSLGIEKGRERGIIKTMKIEASCDVLAEEAIRLCRRAARRLKGTGQDEAAARIMGDRAKEIKEMLEEEQRRRGLQIFRDSGMGF